MSTPPFFKWHPLPPSLTKTTCTLHILQAGSLTLPTPLILLPAPNTPPSPSPSTNKFLVPDYVFHLTHPPSNTTYLFDLGLPLTPSCTPPPFRTNTLKHFDIYPKDPAQILRGHGNASQQPERVKAVIFSHLHFDHFGDGAKSGGLETAELWVGPGSVAKVRPGYPTDPAGSMWEDGLPRDGRRAVVEFSVADEEEDGETRRVVRAALEKGLYEGVERRVPEGGWKPIGSFERAADLFGDASCWMVECRGHMVGHVMLLVRVKVGGDGDEDDWVLLGGDCFHHPDLLREPGRTARPPYAKVSMHGDPELAVESMQRTRAFVERANVWVVGAHDGEIGEAITLGAKEIDGLVELNGWRATGWKNNLGSERDREEMIERTA